MSESSSCQPLRRDASHVSRHVLAGMHSLGLHEGACTLHASDLLDSPRRHTNFYTSMRQPLNETPAF